MSRYRNPWIGVGVSAWSLGVEASAVISLRAMRIAAGGADGEAETRRMVSEKIDAGLALQTLSITGGLGFTPQSVAAKTLAHYRRKVKANRRRLLKSKL